LADAYDKYSSEWSFEILRDYSTIVNLQNSSMAVIRLQLERLTASYRYYFLIPRLSLSLLVLYTFTLPLDSSKRTMILTFVIISIYTFFLFLSIRIGFTNSLETPYAGLFALINPSYQSYYCKKQSSLIFIMSFFV